MGYCGSGVSMASYLGMRVGQKVLGRAEGRTGFDDIGSRPGRSTPAIPGFCRPRLCTTDGATGNLVRAGLWRIANNWLVLARIIALMHGGQDGRSRRI